MVQLSEVHIHEIYQAFMLVYVDEADEETLESLGIEEAAPPVDGQCPMAPTICQCPMPPVLVDAPVFNLDSNYNNNNY